MRQNNAFPTIDDPIETIKLCSRKAASILHRSFTTSLRCRYELDTVERTKYVLMQLPYDKLCRFMDIAHDLTIVTNNFLPRDAPSSFYKANRMDLVSKRIQDNSSQIAPIEI